MLVPFVILMLGATIELGAIYLAKADLTALAQTGMRLAQTGQAQNLTRSQFAAKLCAQAVVLNCAMLTVSLSPVTACASAGPTLPALIYDAAGNIINSFPYNTGTAESVMVLQLLYQQPVINLPFATIGDQPNGDLLLALDSVFANEP